MVMKCLTVGKLKRLFQKNKLRFINYYSVNNWNDSQSNAVKNWKQKMISVWFKDENKISVKKIYDPNLPAPQSNRIVQ